MRPGAARIVWAARPGSAVLEEFLVLLGERGPLLGDAVDGADLDAGLVLHPDAGFGDHERHAGLRKLVSSGKRSLWTAPGKGKMRAVRGDAKLTPRASRAAPRGLDPFPRAP